MEFFIEAKAVKLRSHLDKYLVADDEQEKVRQSRNGSLRKAKWIVELVEGKSNRLRLRSCYGRYLTAADVPSRLGATGNKVLHNVFIQGLDLKYEWEPIRDGFQVKLRSWCGKFLRANGGSPLWRNSISHHDPNRSPTRNWILWDVEAVELPEQIDWFGESIFSCFASDDISGSGKNSPVSVFSEKSLGNNSELQFIDTSDSHRCSLPYQSAMEFFIKAKAVKLRSHLDRYLVADDEQENIRQSRNGSLRKAQWIVELVEGKSNRLRLRSCYGRYLTAADVPSLLGATGNKVLHSVFIPGLDLMYEWEPIRDGFQVKLRSWCGKFLRANGGSPPWRNSISHHDPNSSPTRNWILWDVEAVELPEQIDWFGEGIFSSSASDDTSVSGKNSPMSVFSEKSPRNNSKLQLQIPSNKFTNIMDFFQNAKAVRLRSHHGKYLLADDDEESVTQDRKGSSKNAKWFVELVPEYDNIIRLKSCYGKYLTASNQPFLFGSAGHKALQTLPRRLDSSVEWEPIKDRSRVKLRTRYGNFLRANGGVPPWRNSVTHDIPHRSATQDWVLWDVDIVEIHVQPSGQKDGAPTLTHSVSSEFESGTPSASSTKPVDITRQESSDSNVSSLPKGEGRTIYYYVAEDNGEVDDENVKSHSLLFKGNGVEGLTRKLEEVIGIEGVIVCTRSPLNGKLYPVRLQLPPNNVTMQVFLVLPSSKVARDFEEEGLL